MTHELPNPQTPWMCSNIEYLNSYWINKYLHLFIVLSSEDFFVLFHQIFLTFWLGFRFYCLFFFPSLVICVKIRRTLMQLPYIMRIYKVCSSMSAAMTVSLHCYITAALCLYLISCIKFMNSKKVRNQMPVMVS